MIGHFTVTAGDSKTLTGCALKVVQEYNLHRHAVANISKNALKAYQTNEIVTKLLEAGSENTESIPYKMRYSSQTDIQLIVLYM